METERAVSDFHRLWFMQMKVFDSLCPALNRLFADFTTLRSYDEASLSYLNNNKKKNIEIWNTFYSKIKKKNSKN